MIYVIGLFFVTATTSSKRQKAVRLEPPRLSGSPTPGRLPLFNALSAEDLVRGAEASMFRSRPGGGVVMRHCRPKSIEI